MLSRRDFLGGAVLALPSFQLARAAERGCAATEAVELGPFYRPNAPRRASLCDATETGEPLGVDGRVVAADRCSPLEGAVIEVWQANANGDYDITRRGQDDTPYHLRALLQAGSGGTYAFDTIVPGHYGRRARHIHYFVHAKGYEPLVTQLYFAGDERNATDRLVRRSLVKQPAAAKVRGRSATKMTFDLALRTRAPNPREATRAFPELEGDYRQNDAIAFRLVRSGGRLDARVAGLPDAELIFDGPIEFRVVEYGIAGRVVRDGGGRPALEYQGIDGRRHRADKL
jgi:protocatechuate 3,4-dioxygenase beta subunit